MALPLLIRALSRWGRKRPHTPVSCGALAATAITLVPGLALACPYCAGRSQGGIWTNIVLGAFVFLPFLVSWTIYRIVKAHDASSPATESRREAS
jgi:hypothetical protein